MRGSTVLRVRGENFVDWWHNRLVPDMQGNFDFLGGMLDHEDDLSHMDGPVLLTKIAGLVTNAGGLTAHPAVLSRKVGIPAVVGTQDDTQRITTGDRVRIDGSTGTVAIRVPVAQPRNDLFTA